MSTHKKDDEYWGKLHQRQRENADEIYQEFPLTTKVRVIKGPNKARLGTVVKKPEDEIVSYGPHHVPVKLDGQSHVSPISKFALKIVEK